MNKGYFSAVRLGDITSHISSGSTPRGGQSVYLKEGPVMLVRSQNVRMNKLDLSDVAFISEAMNSEMRRSIVEPDDVLLNITGASIGRVAHFGLSEPRANVNQHVCIIRPIRDRLDARFLAYFLSSPKVQHDIDNRHQHGGTRQALTFAQIADFEIPLPYADDPARSLRKQKRIAAILDKADAIRRKREEAVSYFEDLADSLFGQISRDPDVQPTTIADLLKSETLLVHKDGNFGGNYPRKHEFGPVGIPFLSAKHVAEDGTLIKEEVPRLNEEKARALPFGWIKRGDVLLAHNATVGPVALYEGDYEEALIGTSLTCYRPNPKHLKSEFLFAALRGSHFQRQLQKAMSQTTRNQVPITAQRQLTLHIPTLGHQETFAEQLSQIHRLRNKHVVALADARLLFNSLVQRAFRGEL